MTHNVGWNSFPEQLYPISGSRGMLQALLAEIGGRGRLGQPLFSFQTTNEELGNLREHLRSVLYQRLELKQFEAAAFCLYGAECFRRMHLAGQWTWDTILSNGLQLDRERRRRIRQQYVRNYVSDGMKEWDREIIFVETRRFLTTLVCEGGLPLAILRNENAALTVFLRRVMQERDRFPNRSIVEIASDEEWRLPPSLRDEVVHQWTARVIEVVIDFREALRNNDGDFGDPIAFLNVHVLNWRDRLPFEVADDAARTLLVALIETALSDSTPLNCFEVGTFLQISPAGEAKVLRRLEIADRIEAGFIAKVFAGVNEQNLPSRFHLCLATPECSVQVAVLNRIYDEAAFRVNSERDRALVGKSAIGQVEVTAMIGQRVIGSANDQFGGTALPDSPWIFSNEDERLLGTGRICTARAAVIVVIPNEWTTIRDQGARLEQLGQSAILQRTVFRVFGRVVVQSPDGDEQFEIRSGGEQDVMPSFALRGHRCQLGPAGSEVWRGAPTVWRADSPHGPWRAGGDLLMQWHSQGGPRHWQPIDPACMGDVTIRVLENGECLNRFQTTVMPQDFSIKLLPLPEQGSGEIRLGGLANVACEFAIADGLTIDECDALNGVRRFFVQDRRPASSQRRIELRLRFGENRTAELQISSPARSVQIVDAAGRIVDFSGDVALPLDSLDGLRLIAAIPNANYPHYPPCLVSADGAEIARMSPFGDQDGLFVLGLGLIRDQAAAWLGTDDNVGAAIAFSLLPFPNAPQALATLRIGEHAGQLRQKAQGDGTILLSIPDVVLGWPLVDQQQIRLEVKPLGAPDDEIERPPAAVSDIPGMLGCWQVNPTALAQGPWLATAWINDRICLHPSRITGTMADNDVLAFENVDEFRNILEMQDGNARRDAWRTLMDQLAADGNHPLWEPVNRLMESCLHLPATVFEAVKALTQHPRAIAHWALMYANSRSQELWTRLERLPFLWGLVPVRVWASAFRHQHNIDQAEVWPLRQQNFLQFALPCSSAFEIVASCLSASQVLLFDEFRVAPLMPAQNNAHFEEIHRLRAALVDRHDVQNLRWPGEEFDLPREVSGALNVFGLGNDHVLGFQRPVLTAPIYCAWQLVFAEGFPDREVIVRLQKLRAFDREWFSRCRHHAAYYFASRRFQQNNNWLN